MTYRIIGDRFELKKSLNESQTLWESVDIESRSTVLIRILHITKQSSRGWVRLESNLEEIKKIDSDYIIKTIEWGNCSEGKYIAMEWFDGQPLTDLKLDLPGAIEVLLSVAN